MCRMKVDIQAHKQAEAMFRVLINSAIGIMVLPAAFAPPRASPLTAT